MLCTVTAAIYAALALTLLFIPGLIYWLFELQGNALGDFVAKRAAMLFFGFALMCFMARGSQAAETRRLVAATLALAMTGLALTGIYEFSRGYVGLGIWLAIAVEAAITLSFGRLLLARTNKAIILNDRRPSLHRLKHTANANAARQMHVFADLSAGANRGPSINHCAAINISAKVHK